MAGQIREILSGGTSWSSRYTYAPALRVGSTVFLSGTTGTDDDGRITADARPASTGVIVAGLLREGALIEISTVAILKG
jgi:enamine deaminase RidA (YjgF/YER057c/UK114 family)